MFFKFIQYISPSWYFNLQSNNQLYCIDFDKLSSYEQSLISFDTQYKFRNSIYIDAAYQAFQKGIIKNESYALENQSIITDLSDNYRFVKKYFHPFWVYYIFLVRIISLKNPLKEIRGIAKSHSVHKINLFEKIYSHDDFNKFHSALLVARPLVSVIIPTLNRYPYLKDVLKDLENQTYKNFEVLVYDQSGPFQAEFYKGWNLTLNVVKQEEKALWLARNTAIQQSKGEYILLYDDDSLVENDWIENHIKSLDFFDVDISSGVSISVAGAKVPSHYSFFRWSDQVDTGNVMLRKDIFRKVGLFDRQFEKQRQGDGEFGLRAYLTGFKNISNPLAKRVHLKVKEGGLREIGSWDAFRPIKLLAPRPIPSVLYLIRKYFGSAAAINTILISVPPSFLPYKYKRSNYKFILGFFLFIFFSPVMMYVVWKAWFKSTKMLQEGNKISKLE